MIGYRSKVRKLVWTRPIKKKNREREPISVDVSLRRKDKSTSTENNNISRLSPSCHPSQGSQPFRKHARPVSRGSSRSGDEPIPAEGEEGSGEESGERRDG